MSHIPAAAMKHAGPHLDAAKEASDASPQAGQARPDASLGIGGWSLLALGGTVAVGVIAAVATPVVRKLRGSKQTPTPKRKRAAKSRKSPSS